jgi:NTE family protein
MIKNIAWSGGGIKGVAYAGVLKVMEDNGTLDKVERVAGVSVGAITAVLLALRYSAMQIREIVFALDFNKFKDGGWFLRLLNTYGMYKGDWALIWLESLVYNKTGIKNMTFGQLSPKYRDLTLIATNLNTQGIQIFNKDKTPDVRISEAARASMGIPLYWKRFKFSQGINPNHVFVDGGVLEVLPLSLWDTNDDNPETLGVGLYNAANPVKEYEVPDGDIIKYALSVINTLTDSETAILQQSQDEADRLLWIDDLGYSSTDFNLTADDKMRLFDSGVKGAQTYFEK